MILFACLCRPHKHICSFILGASLNYYATVVLILCVENEKNPLFVVPLPSINDLIRSNYTAYFWLSNRVAKFHQLRLVVFLFLSHHFQPVSQFHQSLSRMLKKLIFLTLGHMEYYFINLDFREIGGWETSK